MLKVIPVETKELQKDLCEQCRTEYVPRALCYRVTDGEVDHDNDTLLAVSQFLMNGEVLCFASAGDVNEDAIFLLARQVLNFIDLCGVHHAEYENRDGLSDALLHRIGFRTEGTHASVNLTDFFAEPCAHGHGDK